MLGTDSVLLVVALVGPSSVDVVFLPGEPCDAGDMVDVGELDDMVLWLLIPVADTGVFPPFTRLERNF